MKKKKSKKQTPVVIQLGEGNTAKGCGALYTTGLLTLQRLKKSRKIGSIVPDNEPTNGPKVLIAFSSLKSVESLIKDLVSIKEEMTFNIELIKKCEKRLRK